MAWSTIAHQAQAPYNTAVNVPAESISDAVSASGGARLSTLWTQLALMVDSEMERHINAAAMPENLREAIRYAALGGGKRLRPALALLCSEAVGGTREAALPAAAAIELIHTFSLVHDDLPAMDDDELRRGRPTLHIHAGEAMAILAGDAMVSLAFEILSGCDLGGEARVSLVRELAGGTTAMIAGQVYDTLGGFPPRLAPRQKLQMIHRNKTEALIRAACRMGGICGGGSASQLLALTQFGEAIGLMFQIVDDLLDVTQTAEHTGKATGKDQSAGKLTYPGLLGVEDSRREVQRLRGVAHEAAARLGECAAALGDVCDFLAVRTR